ncbi:MAG: hypothetical protein ABT940_13890, partial [Alphaproteobacteria bacterium]
MLNVAISKMRFAVAHESADAVRGVSENLKRLGARKVLMLTSQQEMALQFKMTRPDLLFCDMAFSAKGAVALTRLLRIAKDDIAFLPIVLFGPVDPALAAQAIQAGAHEYLATPLTLERIAAVLKAIVRDPRGFVSHTDYVGPRIGPEMAKKYGVPEMDSPPHALLPNPYVRRFAEFGVRIVGQERAEEKEAWRPPPRPPSREEKEPAAKPSVQETRETVEALLSGLLPVVEAGTKVLSARTSPPPSPQRESGIRPEADIEPELELGPGSGPVPDVTE